jgi:putative heme iron utilization protein
MAERTPIRPTDDDARALARGLIDSARFGALGVLDPDGQGPLVTRIAVATDAEGRPLTLISDLSLHTRALRLNPACSLLVGEPGQKGDPLTHPRLTIQARAEFVARGEAEHARLRTRYLAQIPKAKLYIDFADFSLVRLLPIGAHLNGGFGKAFVLTPDDLAARH